MQKAPGHVEVCLLSVVSCSPQRTASPACVVGVSDSAREGRGGVGRMLEVLVLKVRSTRRLPRGASPRVANILPPSAQVPRGSLSDKQVTVAPPGSVGCRCGGKC